MVKRYLPLSLLLVTAVFAQPGRGVGIAPLSWQNQLNLTTEQLGQIDQLFLGKGVSAEVQDVACEAIHPAGQCDGLL